MKLIIDLDDDIAKGIRGENDCEVEPREIVRSFQATIADAIANGTPLPKGHGRLIDADKLDTRERGNNSQRTMWWNIDCIVKDAETIIEADTESDNE